MPRRRSDLTRRTPPVRRRFMRKPRPVDDLVREAAVRAEVFARDGYRCALNGVPGTGPCFGPLTFGHVLRASQGGTYTATNGRACCGEHNRLCAQDARVAAIALDLGVIARRWS